MVEVEKSNSSSRNAGETCAATPKSALGGAKPFLLPCPFCNGQPHLARIISPEGEARGERPSFDIQCDDCWVWGRFDSEEDAIERWNARPTEPTSESKSADRGE